MNHKERIDRAFRRFEQGFILGPSAFWVSNINSRNDLHMSLITRLSSHHIHVTPGGRATIYRERRMHNDRALEIFNEALRRAETGDNEWRPN